MRDFIDNKRAELLKKSNECDIAIANDKSSKGVAMLAKLAAKAQLSLLSEVEREWTKRCKKVE